MKATQDRCQAFQKSNQMNVKETLFPPSKCHNINTTKIIPKKQYRSRTLPSEDLCPSS